MLFRGYGALFERLSSVGHLVVKLLSRHLAAGQESRAVRISVLAEDEVGHLAARFKIDYLEASSPDLFSERRGQRQRSLEACGVHRHRTGETLS